MEGGIRKEKLYYCAITVPLYYHLLPYYRAITIYSYAITVYYRSVTAYWHPLLPPITALFHRR